MMPWSVWGVLKRGGRCKVRGQAVLEWTVELSGEGEFFRQSRIAS